VRCNVICPTWVRTAVLEEELAASPEYKAMITSLVPIKRAAEGEELADKIAYLLSPSASYINGASVLLDAAATTTARLF
jgi:NAD(P)-dependent dehydrogenase (short-subunit alcohol dehydrogenase family)